MNLKNKPLILLLSGLLLLSGCGKNDGEDVVNVSPLIEGEYGFVLPYTTSSAPVVHKKYLTSKNESYKIGKYALELCKKHFDPDKYLVREGGVVEATELERFDTTTAEYRALGLLKFKTSFNSAGLNPEKGTYIDNGNGVKMYNAILVADVIEHDYIPVGGKIDEYAGFTFTIVLNENVSYQEPELNADGTVKTDSSGNVILKPETKTGKITDDQLFAYGSVEAGQRLVDYLRNNHPMEVGNLPIHILLYKASGADSELPGVFIGESYQETRASQYTRINQEWVFAPSERLNRMNPILSSQFDDVKKTLFETYPTDVGIIGRVFFQDDMAEKMEIEVNMQAKTFVEAQTIVQYMATLSERIKENGVALRIHVYTNGESVGILTREKDSDQLKITMN